MIADRVEGLALGVRTAALEQLGIEDLLLDVGVHVELVGERPPHPLQRVPVVGGLGLQVVEPGELLAEPVVVGEDQHGDVGHPRPAFRRSIWAGLPGFPARLTPRPEDQPN